MRLLDWILSQNRWPTPTTSARAKELVTSEAFVIDNVARYYFQSWPGEVMQLQDFPNLAPPFRSFFMEWKAPLKVNIGGEFRDAPSQAAGAYMGVQFDVMDMSKESAARRALVLEFLGATPWLERDFRWCFACLPWGYEKRRGPYAWSSATFFFVADDGSPVIGEGDKQYVMTGEPGEIAWLMQMYPIRSQEEIAGFFSSMLQPALLAISFLHCKNTYEVTQRPPAAQAKKRRKQGVELVTYKTLAIEPICRVLKYEGEAESRGIKYALHICRGHFKDYREKGLFGKYKGIYWWAQHLRGDLDEGVVVKDYKVNRTGE